MILNFLNHSSYSHQKFTHLLIILILYNSLNFLSSAQTIENGTNILLITAIKQIESNIQSLNLKISYFISEISKCDKTIANSEKIIKLTREKGNSEAEKIANNALLKSKSARDKNKRLLESATKYKQQSDIILSSLKKDMFDNSSSNKTNAVTLNYSGNISVQKGNGDQYKINDTGISLIESGDIVSTSNDSKIDLQFMEGRGNLTLGENSKLKFSKTDSLNVVEFINGKVKITVEKMDALEKKLKESYEKLKTEVGSLPESFEQFMNRQRAKLKKKLEVRIRSSGTASIRGTEFIINYSDNNGTEFIVLEGAVEINSKDGTKTIIVNAGEKGIINIKGVLKDPERIDIDTLKKWWLDEE